MTRARRSKTGGYRWDGDDDDDGHCSDVRVGGFMAGLLICIVRIRNENGLRI